MNTGITGTLFDRLLFRTTGGNPNNQTSRDVLTADNNGYEVIHYYNTSDVSAVAYDGNYKVLFFGFGFEAIYGGTSLAPPDTIMARILNWFSVGVEEEYPDNNMLDKSSLLINGSSVNNALINISAVIKKNQIGDIYVFDITWRKIKTLAEHLESGRYQLSWDWKDENNFEISNGIYFIVLNVNNNLSYERIILIK